VRRAYSSWRGVPHPAFGKSRLLPVGCSPFWLSTRSLFSLPLCALNSPVHRPDTRDQRAHDIEGEIGSIMDQNDEEALVDQDDLGVLHGDHGGTARRL
jgi:hypothetical protein